MNPGQLALSLKGNDLLAIDIQQVNDVQRGIFQLRVGQGPLQPVGAGFLLADLQIQKMRDQFLIANREADTQGSSRNLGIKQGARQSLEHMMKDLQVFRAGMKYLGHGFVFKQVHNGT